MKYDTVNNEPFITPTSGLYPKSVISVEEFKDRNARIMKNCWIDTSHGAKGEKIYELFNPDMDGEIVKLNEHHQCVHNPQKCGICNRTFALALSLTRHMYDHEEKKYNCDMCKYSSHFKSELETHKIVHKKTNFTSVHARKLRKVVS